MPARNITARNRAHVIRAIRSIGGGNPQNPRHRQIVMATVLDHVARKQFRSFLTKSARRRDEFGQNWKRLAASTIKRKGHADIGQDTLELINSLTPGTLSEDRYIPVNGKQIAEIRGTTIVYGTSVEHAKFFNAKRRIFPSIRNMATWVREGVSRGVERLAEDISRES